MGQLIRAIVSTIERLTVGANAVQQAAPVAEVVAPIEPEVVEEPAVALTIADEVRTQEAPEPEKLAASATTSIQKPVKVQSPPVVEQPKWTPPAEPLEPAALTARSTTSSPRSGHRSGCTRLRGRMTPSSCGGRTSICWGGCRT